MADEEEQPENEQEVYDNRVYNLTINFNNCQIDKLHIEQYGKPVGPPPPPGGS